MTEQTKITCDLCSKDLTFTGNCVDYRLKLMDEIIPPYGSSVTAMMRYPSLKDGSRHFCGIVCLRGWMQKL